MKKFLLSVTALAFTGCTVLNSHQVKHPDGSVESRTRIVSFWDSKSELQKLRSSISDKNQSLNLAGLDLESSSTNTVELFRAIGQILQNLPK